MPSKRLELTITNRCDGCPFLQYNGDYGMSYDSGHDCHHPDSPQYRVANDGEIERYRREMNEYRESLKTLFPKEKPTRIHPLTIPDWCPLPNAEV